MVVPFSTRWRSNALIWSYRVRPDRFRHELVDADDQHLLVVGSIEDADLALTRCRLVDPPQVVVGRLLGLGTLKDVTGEPCGLNAVNDLLDGPVLAGGVDTLQDDEYRPFGLRPETILQVGQALELSRRLILGRGFVPAQGVTEIALRESDARARLDPEGRREGRSSAYGRARPPHRRTGGTIAHDAARFATRRSASMTVATGTKPHPIFLAGRWVDSPDVLDVANPADPGTRRARRITRRRSSTRRRSAPRSRPSR